MHRFERFSLSSPFRFAMVFAAVWLAVPDAEAQVCEGYIELITQEEVDAFECEEVIGSLKIYDRWDGEEIEIRDLSGLSELTNVGGSLHIYLSHGLTSLDGLDGLSSANGVIIDSNDGLTSLSGLAGLTSVGEGVWIRDNDTLTSLDGLEGLASIGGDLIINGNFALTSLDGLEGLASVGGRLVINGNDDLTSLDGLGGFTSVEDLLILNNKSLTSLVGLEGLSSIGYFLRIENNNALTSLGGLEGLTSVGDYAWIKFNGALTSLGGLDGLASIGALDIRNNDALTSLGGLEGLASVRRNLLILNNKSLTNVDGLADVTHVGRNLRVHDNASLSECTVGLAPLLLEGELGGTHRIRDNAPGCNSYWEAVGANVDAEDEATPLVTGLAAPYPNPTAGATTLMFTLAEPGEVSLTVYDALGRRVAVLAEGTHAAGVYKTALGAELPAGVYVVRFEAGEQAWTERVTVVR